MKKIIAFPSSKNLYILRHAESEANVKRKTPLLYPKTTVFLRKNLGRKIAEYFVHFCDILFRGKTKTIKIPDREISITKSGIKASIEKGKAFAQKGTKLDILLVSPYRRTLETAKYFLEGYRSVISDADPKIFILDNLREKSFGKLEIYPGDYLRNLYPHAVFNYEEELFRPPKGENLIDVKNRLQPVKKYLEKQFKNKDTNNVLIIAHGISNKTLISMLTKKKLTELQNMKNLDLYKIDFKSTVPDSSALPVITP